MTLAPLAFGFVCAAAAALLAYRLGTLPRGGAAAATAVGGLTFSAGGVLPGVLLMLFFVTSSVLSRLGTRRKGRVAAQFEKGGPPAPPQKGPGRGGVGEGRPARPGPGPPHRPGGGSPAPRLRHHSATGDAG